jgi:SAM-dependent methyltransferase
MAWFFREGGGTVIDNRQSHQKEVWAAGTAYDPYVGRWSRLVARKFLEWLTIPAESQWLDVGCGTGALSQTILQLAAPHKLKGVDRSADYIVFTQEQTQDERAHFEVGDAQALPVETEDYDAVVSGLVLNFIPQPEQAVAEMARAARLGGVVAAYVWDYAGKMQLMRHFWNAVTALDPTAYNLDEGRRFPLCQPEPLAELFKGAGLKDVVVQAINIDTDFKDFDDYWNPFLGGQGPAPGYAVSLSEERRAALRERIRIALPFALDGSIPLVARAWAVRGNR